MSFPALLFTRDPAPKNSGWDGARPLARGEKLVSLDGAVKHAEKLGIVSADGSTIIMAPDAVFIMIGHTKELTNALGPKGGTMKYLLITSSDDDRDMALYTDRRSVSPIQSDTLYLLGGPSYWGSQIPRGLQKVSFADGGGQSRAIHLGWNDDANPKDATMITDLIRR